MTEAVAPVSGGLSRIARWACAGSGSRVRPPGLRYDGPMAAHTGRMERVLRTLSKILGDGDEVIADPLKQEQVRRALLELSERKLARLRDDRGKRRLGRESLT